MNPNGLPPSRSLDRFLARSLAGALMGLVLSAAACDCGAVAPGGGEEGEGEGAAAEGEGEGGGLPGAPTVTISNPAEGAFLRAGDSVTFNCAAVDDGAPVQNGSIAWSASGDGPLGVGAVITNALVTLGAQGITCSATDVDGNVGRAGVNVTVVDQFPPTATIVQPGDGAFFGANATITFSGNAFDTEDGAVGNARLRWLADGAAIGVGAAISTALPTGDHTIVFEATDADGAIGTDSVVIHVVDNIPPTCTILTPQGGASLGTGQSTTFSASCRDPDGPVANDAISWTSNVDGALGIGATVTNALVTAGAQTITVCARDPQAAAVVGCASVDVTVGDNRSPTVPVVSPQNGGTFAACQTIDLRCSAQDPEGQAVSLSWSSSLEGNIQNGGDISWDPRVSGVHVLTCRARDPQGAESIRQITVTVVSPSADIRQPGNGDTFALGDTITFDGRACDTESGDLAGNQMQWSSNRDGAIGSGRNFDFSNLSLGQHVITLTASDGANVGQAAVSIVIEP